MNKKAKVIIISLVSILLVACILVGGFLIIFPFSPKVEIASAQTQINNTESVFVASYNTAAPWGNLIEGTHTTRRMHLFAQQINNTLPDSLGVQEINSIWTRDLQELLPQYEYYGVKRGGDENEQKSEMNGIYYLKDKYELLESNTFWLSDTPEVESKFDGAGCYRICSYVVLESIKTGFTYIHMNTHFDNSSVEAQNLGGKLVCEYAEALAKKYENVPIVITGDFNQYSNGESVKLLVNEGYINTNGGDTTATYHGWGENPHTEPIDYIFVKGFTVSDYKVHTDTGARSDISDHYMISVSCQAQDK